MLDKTLEENETIEQHLTHITPLDNLTKRELEVLRLIAQGYRNADIAKAMYITDHTVNDYTKKIYRKLDVHSRHSAAQIYILYTKQNR
ncbi:MAG: response regulator transcription factor [Ruminococcaceae bacterium]|nr:response regulator transcription factor [Oscillospiraceae bacterium]